MQMQKSNILDHIAIVYRDYIMDSNESTYIASTFASTVSIIFMSINSLRECDKAYLLKTFMLCSPSFHFLVVIFFVAFISLLDLKTEYYGLPKDVIIRLQNLCLQYTDNNTRVQFICMVFDSWKLFKSLIPSTKGRRRIDTYIDALMARCQSPLVNKLDLESNI